MEIMNEQFVSIETAKMLRDAGFDEFCYFGYNIDGEHRLPINTNNSLLPNGYVAAPTQALATRWLREVHKLHAFAELVVRKTTADSWQKATVEVVWHAHVRSADNGHYITISINPFNTYEEAVEASIQYSIDHIKEHETH